VLNGAVGETLTRNLMIPSPLLFASMLLTLINAIWIILLRPCRWLCRGLYMAADILTMALCYSVFIYLFIYL